MIIRKRSAEQAETEMKTYAAAVMKSCSTALAPNRIETAVKKVTDKEMRNLETF